MAAVMIVLMVMMMLMMIPMMPGVIAMTMAAIPPPFGREIPRQIYPCRSSSPLCLVSASWRRQKIYSSMPPMILDQRVVVCQRGAGGGATGARAGPTCGLGWARNRGRPCPLELHSVPPFGSVTYSSKY